MAERVETADVTCPFCGEGDFDLVGLKMHIKRGWCDPCEELDASTPRPAPIAQKEEAE